jgi:hypothetical protein
MAVLAFFAATDNSAIKDAFEDLLAILFNARGSLFLRERGRTSFEATHEFLEAWQAILRVGFVERSGFPQIAQPI